MSRARLPSQNSENAGRAWNRQREGAPVLSLEAHTVVVATPDGGEREKARSESQSNNILTSSRGCCVHSYTVSV